MLRKPIVFFGASSAIVCDGKCNKAWGINSRPKIQLSEDVDDFAYLSDGELGEAPADPGTYEGACGKPRTATPEAMNKRCARECERHVIVKRDEIPRLRDFSNWVFNDYARGRMS